MNVDFINPFLSSMLNVMATMAQTELQPEKPRKKKDEVAMGDVTGIIGMISDQAKGSLSITFEKELAFEVMQRMLGEKPTVINNDVTDMVGEITNMVTGGAKAQLEGKGYNFDMATPAVVSGANHTITHKADGPVIIMPFNADAGRCFIEFSFT